MEGGGVDAGFRAFSAGAPRRFLCLLTRQTIVCETTPGKSVSPASPVRPRRVTGAYGAAPERKSGWHRSTSKSSGYLPDYCVTGYRCHAGGGDCDASFRDYFRMLTRWPKCLRFPWFFLMNLDNHQEHSILRDGQPRRFFAIPYGKYFIWGATAGIIMSLHRALMA